MAPDSDASLSYLKDDTLGGWSKRRDGDGDITGGRDSLVVQGVTVCYKLPFNFLFSSN